MKKIGLILLLVSPLFWLAGCGKTPDASEAYLNETPSEIYFKGREALKSKSYSEAIKRFEALDVQYPFAPVTEHAELDLIYAYYMKEDYDRAFSEASHFIRMHPGSQYVDYAYFMRALCTYYQNVGVLERVFHLDISKRDLTKIQKSYDYFSELVNRQPESIYAPAAQQYMVYLRNLMASHELHIALYYFRRQACVAAISRASNVVAHYQGAPAARDALIVMAKSYGVLGLQSLELDTMRVIQVNYPTLPTRVENLKLPSD